MIPIELLEDFSYVMIPIAVLNKRKMAILAMTLALEVKSGAAVSFDELLR